MNFKKLLIFSVVIMLLGMTIVSAAETDDADSGIVEVQQTTHTTEKIPVTTTGNKNIKSADSPEIDDTDGVVTTVSTDVVSDYVESQVQLNATVDRTIPGARLSDGNVVFSREGVNITDLVPVKDGEASVTITLEEDWIGTSTLVAKYIGTDTIKSSESEEVDFIVVPKVETVIELEPVSDYIDTTVNLTAVVDSVNPGLKINEGKISFYTSGREFAVADVINGTATAPLTLTEDLTDYTYIQASYSGTRIYNQSTSTQETFNVVPKVETVLVLDPVVGFVGETVQLNATVDSVNPGLKINEGVVEFYTVAREFGTADVINGTASLNITLSDDLINYKQLMASYGGRRIYNDSECEPVNFTVLTKDSPVPPSNITPNKNIPKHRLPQNIVKTPAKNVNKVATTQSTHKILVNNNVVFSGNAITLEALNNIFGLNFANGHLVVYIDGKVVFNGTVTDNLSQIIADILDDLVGQHELKIEFTNSEGVTNTYKETIVIQ